MRVVASGVDNKAPRGTEAGDGLGPPNCQVSLGNLIDLEIWLSRITEYMYYGNFKWLVNSLSHKYQIHKCQRATIYKH